MGYRQLSTVCCVLLLAAAASASIGWSGNLTKAQLEVHGGYRLSKSDTFGGTLVAGSWMYSLTVDAQAVIDKKPPTAHGEIDAFYALGLVAPSAFPISMLAYFDAAIDLTTKLSLTQPLTINLNGTAGMMANAYLFIVETTPAGTIVKNYSLSPALFPLSPKTRVGSWSKSDSGEVPAPNGGSAKFVTLHGSPVPLLGGDVNVYLTFAVTDVPGILSLGETPVVPKALESIFQLSGWTLDSPQNHLTLYMAVISATADFQDTSVVSWLAGSSKPIYTGLNNKATVNGLSAGVTFTGWAEGSVTDIHTGIKATFDAAGVANVKAKIIGIEFPAGATEITYDPALGVGDNPFGASSTLMPSIGLFCFFNLLLQALYHLF